MIVTATWLVPQSPHNCDTITYFVLIIDVINRVEIGSSGPTRPIFCAMYALRDTGIPVSLEHVYI